MLIRRDLCWNYAITIENPGNKNYIIKSVKPIINDNIQELLIDENPSVIEETRKLKSNSKIEFKGELHINTIHLSEEAKKNLIPVIKEYEITYDQDKSVILKSGL